MHTDKSMTVAVVIPELSNLFSMRVIEAIERTAEKRGYRGLIGVGKQNLDFNFTLIQKKKLNVYGSHNALKKDFTKLINMVATGKVDPEKVLQWVSF